MDTAWLEVFRDVAHTGSFTATATRTGYTQSAISRQIAALESEVGSALFTRLPRGVRLTEPGRHLLGHAEVILDRLREAGNDLRALDSLTAGRVRLGSFASAGVRLVPRAIAVFRTRHPEIEVSHHDGLTRQLVSLVAADDLDVAVINGFADQIAAIEGMRLTHLLDETLLVALPGGHRLADRDMVTLDELSEENWIAGHPTPGDTLVRACLSRGFYPRIAHVTPEWIAKQGFVAEGLGVTLIPALAADSVRGDVRLARIASAEMEHRAVYAATSAAAERSTATTALIDVLRDIARRSDHDAPAAKRL